MKRKIIIKGSQTKKQQKDIPEAIQTGSNTNPNSNSSSSSDVEKSSSNDESTFKITEQVSNKKKKNNQIIYSHFVFQQPTDKGIHNNIMKLEERVLKAEEMFNKISELEKRVTVLEDKLKSLKSLDDKGSADSQGIENKKLDKEQKRKLGQGLRQNKHFSQNKFADEIILKLMQDKLFTEWE